jgi:hypothetical protein
MVRQRLAIRCLAMRGNAWQCKALFGETIMATLNFDANEVDPNVGFEVLPQGRYLAVITESEMKPTKKGGGSYLKFTFQILEGEYKGRLLWAQLNLDNTSETTVRIARAELSAICRAVGVMAPRDSIELHGIPLLITVGHKKRNDTGELGNTIRAYSRKEAANARLAPAATANGKAPWKR